MSLGSRSRTPAIMQIFGTALKAWWDDDAPRLGAALAYYTLFAIAPVLLVATGIASLVFNTDAVRGEVVNQLDHLVGHEGAHAVQSLLAGASQQRAGIIATTIGSVAFVIAATGAFLELQAALNTVWRVKSNPNAHLKAFLIDRLRMARAPLLERPTGVERSPGTRLAHRDDIAVRPPLSRLA
jgi:membrane protein